MILLGGFAVYIFEVAGGTDYEYKYLGLASVVAGLCIMILLAFPTVRKFNLAQAAPLGRLCDPRVADLVATLLSLCAPLTALHPFRTFA